jgi:transposase
MLGEYADYRLHFQDETRLGRFTRTGKRLTAKGIKPIGIKQTVYESYYLYGTVEPESGGFLMCEYDTMSSHHFQDFLHEFAQTYSDGNHLIVVDGARIHFARHLNIPERIKLLALPPYCPELNPIERLWLYLKQRLNWKNWMTLDELKDVVMTHIEDWDELAISQLTSFPFVLEALNERLLN